MSETFQHLRTPVCNVITDLHQRRIMHALAKRTPRERLRTDLEDSLKLMARQQEANGYLLEQDKRMLKEAMQRLAARTSEAMMQSFVTNELLVRSRKQ